MSNLDKTNLGDVVIPNKMFFRIGEVSEIVDVETHVIRYWESEFPQIAPRKGRGQQRLFSREDVQNILRIKRLLYEEGYTIDGARKALQRNEDSLLDRKDIDTIKGELREIRAVLKKVSRIGA